MSNKLLVKKKVAILLPCLLTGGTEVATLNTALAFENLGYSAEIIIYFDEIDSTMLDLFKMSGFAVHVLGIRRWSSTASCCLAARLFIALKRGHFNIVWVQYMTPTLLPLIIARFFTNSLIATVHVVSSHYSATGLKRLRWLAQHWCAKFVCVSHTVANGIFGVETGISHSAKRMAVIPNALDMKVMKVSVVRDWRCELAWPQDAVVLGFTGRLAHNKGADVLLHAMALLHQQNMPVRLVVVGDGAEQSKLRALTQELNINAVTHFAGRLPRAEIYGAVKGFDVAVVPSREEGFGLSALEAMAAGVPVVASRVDALQEVVLDNVTGLLCEVDDPVSLANALTRLLRDVEYRQKMGAAGQAHAARFYDVSAYRARLADLLQGMGLPVRTSRSPA